LAGGGGGHVRAKQAATRECKNKEYKDERILQPVVSIATLQNTVFEGNQPRQFGKVQRFEDILCLHHRGMTTDVLLHSEHAGVCPSGFIKKERGNKENWEGISKGRKNVQQN
jgi:hypothetical protein